MFRADHAPPHFHAIYAEYEIVINIQTLEPINGHFPRRALSLVLEWAVTHRQELMENWTACRNMPPLHQIPPLV